MYSHRNTALPRSCVRSAVNDAIEAMIAFGVDPMTGRAAALANGHGFVGGWAVAIAGDMLYYAVIAFTTLQLNAYFKDPNTVMFIVLAGMIVFAVLFIRNQVRAIERLADERSADI